MPTLLHRLVLSIELGTVQTGTWKVDPARKFKCTTAARLEGQTKTRQIVFFIGFQKMCFYFVIKLLQGYRMCSKKVRGGYSLSWYHFSNQVNQYWSLTAQIYLGKNISNLKKIFRLFQSMSTRSVTLGSFIKNVSRLYIYL